MDIDVLVSTTIGFNPLYLAGAIALIVLQILFLGLRWHFILNSGRVRTSFNISLFMNIAGYFANVLFITSVGGILAKSALALRHGFSIGQTIFATVLDRFMTFLTLVSLSIIGLPFLFGVLDQKLLITLALSTVCLSLFILVCFAIVASGGLEKLIVSNRKLARFAVSLRKLKGQRRFWGYVGVQSLVAQLCYITAVYILSLGIDGGHTQTIEFFALMPILALVASLPVSFGGWGLREGAFIYGLGLIGFSIESAFLLSIQVGLLTLFAPFIVGLPYLLTADYKSYLGTALPRRKSYAS
tara:strand:+ start:3285 stop:4181 length:897 start_codon:yes stop_codon:yes gene_type:complete